MVKKRQTLLALILTGLLSTCIYQRADMSTDMTVKVPAFSSRASPIVLFDADHQNFHDLESTFKPFATLLRNDGVTLRSHTEAFTLEVLEGADLLIITNAMGPDQNTTSAFTQSEIKSLIEWVRTGGSLLLIADHDPFGSAASALADAFGVGMESVWTVDTLRMNEAIGKSTWLEFTRDNEGLGSHPILNPGSSESRINRVITFTGQSLSFDSTWAPILQLSESARNYYTRDNASVISADVSTYFPVPGQAQLIAREYGAGRIVIAGEAAMFTAQEVRIFFKTMRAGFNYAGYDNKQLILNIVQWLLEVSG